MSNRIYSHNELTAEYNKGYQAAVADYDLLSTETANTLAEEAYAEGLYDGAKMLPLPDAIMWISVGVAVGAAIGWFIF